MSFFEFPHTRTYDSDLGWLIKDTHSLDEQVEAIKQWIIDTQPTLQELENLYRQLENGILPAETYNKLRMWIDAHIVEFIGDAIKTVAFEITDTGYFVALIPDSWTDIIFGTSGYDTFPSGVDYGHLTLTY